jgi:phage tail-like protein
VTVQPASAVVASRHQASRYLDHLPPAFREHPFAGEFLLAFEAILHGHDDVEGLAQLIGRVADYLDPRTAPPDFLPWLASWVSLSLRADWDVDTQRSFIADIVPLYRRRGTPEGLERMLEIYLQPPDADRTRDVVEVRSHSTDPPHFFLVQLTLSDADPSRLRRTQEIARAIIDQEKPAHTYYALKVVIPTMRLVQGLQLGRNTWLGSSEALTTTA